MKYLFTTQPGVGHLNPLVPIARGLAAEGHEVAVACAASFVPRVEAAGLRAIPAGVDWLQTAPEQAFPETEGMTPFQRELFLTDIFADTTALAMAGDLLELFESWRPDVVVRDAYEYGGCAVAERWDIPHAVVDVEFYVPPYVTRQGLEQPLSYLRSVCGLSPAPAMEMLERYLYLPCIPPSYQFPEYRLPEVTHALRPAYLDPSGSQTLPDWVHGLPDRPLVYATMGTTFNNVPMIFRQIIAGLAELPLNLIITVGRNQDPRQFDPLPANVHVEQFIPQAALMPHCQAVIANGGMGTNLIALSYGVPLLLIPLSGHLLLHSLRCRALGIGRTLKLPTALFEESEAELATLPDNYVTRQAWSLLQDDSPELTPESMAAAVMELVEEPEYRQAAQKMQVEMANLPGPDYAVRLLERLAVERAPIRGGSLEVSG